MPDSRFRSTPSASSWPAYPATGRPAWRGRFFELRGGSAAEWLDQLGGTAAYGAVELELGRAALEIPVAGEGASPASLRSAARPAFLDERDEAGRPFGVEWSVPGSGASLARTFHAAPRPLEFAPRPARLEPRRARGWPAPTPRVAAPREPRPHPSAPWWIALGVVLGTFASSRRVSVVKESVVSDEG